MGGQQRVSEDDKAALLRPCTCRRRRRTPRPRSTCAARRSPSSPFLCLTVDLLLPCTIQALQRPRGEPRYLPDTSPFLFVYWMSGSRRRAPSVHGVNVDVVSLPRAQTLSSRLPPSCQLPNPTVAVAAAERPLAVASSIPTLATLPRGAERKINSGLWPLCA